MGGPLLSAPLGTGGPLGQGAQPRTPSSPYLQGGQQSGQLGELLLEGLVLLLILAGGGAGSLISKGRAAHPPGTSGWGNAIALPAVCTLPCPPPCALNLLAFLTGGWVDTGMFGSPGRGGAWLGPTGREPGICEEAGVGQGWRPHSPLHSLQQQRFPLCQFVLGGTVCC